MRRPNPGQHCPTLKRLIDAHLFLTALVTQSVVQKDALEVDDFNLILKQLTYDQQACEVWQNDIKHVYISRESAAHERRLQRKTKVVDLAQLFMQRRSKLIVWVQARPEHAAGELMSFRCDAMAATWVVDFASVKLSCS